MSFQWNIPAIEKKGLRASRYRLGLFLLFGAVLVWGVLTRTLVAYLAETKPELALRLRPSSSAALVQLAEQELHLAAAPKPTDLSANAHQSSVPNLEPTLEKQEGSQSGQRSKIPSFYPIGLSNKAAARVKTWAELAIRNDPLNARAFGILGRVSDIGTDKDQTRRLMQAAVRRSLHETLAVSWMMLLSYQNEDYHAALSYADVLLRTNPGFFSAAMPILGSIAETKNPELKQLLATDPPWRPEFLYQLPAYITDARTPLEILLSLKDSGTPPTIADLESYLDFLVRHGFYDLAYYTWLQFLPAEQLSKAGRLFNGSFEGEPSGQPFDWVLSKGAGYITKIAARRDANGARALFIQLGPGRVDFGGVQQLIILPPGNYRLEGQYKSDLVSDRGVYWQIGCANGKKTLGETEPFNGTSRDWKDFAVSFAVPDTECPAQYVTLVSAARSASEQFLSGTVWYDDLRIDEGAREAAHDLPAR